MPDAQAIPGTDMDVKGLLRLIQARPAAMSADLAASQADLEKSTKAVADLRSKQQSERAPLVDKIKGKSEESLPEYNPKALPSFEHKGPDPDEMWNTISLLTAVAAMGGALTRQPLTAALNNFSAGVKGMVQGDEALYKRELQSFKLNFDKAKTENDELYKKAQQAREKHGTELQSLMNEMTTLAAEHQDQILSEMLKRGDIVSAQNLIVKRHEMMAKADTDTVRILGQQQNHADSLAHQKVMERLAAQRESRLNTSQVGASDWSPEEIAHAAESYRTIGSQALVGLPPRSPIRQQIVRQAMQSSMKEGEPGSAFGAKRAEYMADAASLRKIAPMYDAVSAWSSMVDLNGQILKDLGSKVDKNKAPVIERYTRALKRGVDPKEEGADVAEFFAQLQIYNTEVARALTNPSLTGVVTDSSRQEISDLIQRGASKAQLDRVVDRLGQDTHNRLNTIENQYKEIDKRIRSGGGLKRGGAASPTATPKATLNGRTIVPKDGAWVYEDSGEAAQ